MYEGDDLSFEDDDIPPEESSNRTFLIAAGGLGLIVLLSIACLAGYALVILPQQQAEVADDQSAIAAQNAQNALINEALTATQFSFSLSQTPLATATLAPTNTPVVAQPSATNTLEFTLTPDPSTATVAAALSQVALTTETVFPTSTALPDSGFADDVGLPGLVIASMVFVAVIFLARKLRTVQTK